MTRLHCNCPQIMTKKAKKAKAKAAEEGDAVAAKEAGDRAQVFDSLQLAHKCILNSVGVFGSSFLAGFRKRKHVYVSARFGVFYHQPLFLGRGKNPEGNTDVRSGTYT